MKNKKLIVFLIVLAFLTVLIVLNSTLFTLQTINVNWLTTKYNLDSVKDYTLIENIDKGDSIFLVKKDKIKFDLEKRYPYLQVVNIETKFPNKIVIHTAERESMFAVKLTDNNYAIVDEKGKVLELRDSSIFEGLDLSAKPIKVFFEGLPINTKQFLKGEMISNDAIVKLLSQLSYSLRESDYIPTTSKRIIANIDIKPADDGFEIYLKTRNGMRIVLNDGLNYTTDKLLLALQIYDKNHENGVITGDIIVWQSDSDNKIVARYENVSE